MREPLACPLTFVTAVCEKAAEESPRAAAIAADFRAQARRDPAMNRRDPLNRHKATAACPTSRSHSHRPVLGILQRGWTSGAVLGRLSVTRQTPMPISAPGGGDRVS